MKKVIYLLFILLLGSCEMEPLPESSALEIEIDQKTETTDSTEENLKSFTSKLRPNWSDWNLDSIYSDTLEFISFNDDSDYGIASFRMKDGTLAHLISNQPIAGVNRNYIVEWKLGKFSEAGENEEAYLKEEVKSATPIASSYSLKALLTNFYQDYKLGDKNAIEKYLHPNASLLCSFNPGAYCTLGRDFGLYKPEPIIGTYLISSETPKGGACEGFEGASDGLYYSFITTDNIPKFDDLVNDKGPVRPVINSNIEVDGYAKVIVMTNEYSAINLYFFNAHDQWYFWIDDLCDCSA